MYRKTSDDMVLSSCMYSTYSSLVGIFPRREEMAVTSEEARYTLHPSPILFGKFLVDVETIVAPSAALA